MSNDRAEQAADGFRPPRRVRWLLRGIVAVPVVFLVAAGLLWWTQGRTVARKFAAIRQRGEPVTAAELEDYYVRPPADKDTTDLWVTASANLSAAARLSVAGQATPVAKLPFVGKGPDPPPPGQAWAELPLAEKFLKDNAAAMQMLHKAAAKGGAARYPTDFSQGIMMLLPEVMNLRQSARCLAMEASVRAHRGDAAGTIESIRAILALSKSLETDPHLLSQLIRIAICGTADGQLKELLPATPFADANLAQLEDELLATDFQPALYRALVGGRVLGIIAFDNPGGLGVGRVANFAQRLLFSANMSDYLSAMEDYIAATNQPWPAALTETKKVSNECNARVGRFNVLTKLLIPGLDAATEASARGTGRCRMMALAVALERYRRAKAKPPATLDELAPQFIREVPLDPYTGKAFNYRVTAAGYVVYSLGGVKSPQYTDAETGARKDLLFRWPPKPKPAPAVEDGEDAGDHAPQVDDATPDAEAVAPGGPGGLADAKP
jgi:hypothetical protein